MKIVRSQWSVVSNDIFAVSLSALLFALCFPVHAQRQPKIPRIGYVRVIGTPSTPGPNVEAFRRGLRDLGYVESENIAIEFRYAEGKPDRIPSLVAELVQLKVDVLVVWRSTRNPRRQASDQDDSHCDGD